MVQKKHYVSRLYEYLFTYRHKSLIKFLLKIHLYDFCFKNSNFNLFFVSLWRRMHGHRQTISIKFLTIKLSDPDFLHNVTVRGLS